MPWHYKAMLLIVHDERVFTTHDEGFPIPVPTPCQYWDIVENENISYFFPNISNTTWEESRNTECLILPNLTS